MESGTTGIRGARVIMTAHDIRPCRRRPRGAFDYLTKPFVRDELRARSDGAGERGGRVIAKRLLASGRRCVDRIMDPSDPPSRRHRETTEASAGVFQIQRGAPTVAARRRHRRGGPGGGRALGHEKACRNLPGIGNGAIVARRSWCRRPGRCPRDRDVRTDRARRRRPELLRVLLAGGRAIRTRRARAPAPCALAAWPMATQVAHELKNRWPLRLYARHLGSGDQDGDAEGAGSKEISGTVDTWRRW